MNEWVKIGSSDFCTYEYNSSSVEIDKQNNIIGVWVKSVFTDEGINKLIYSGIKDNFSDAFLEKISKIGYSLSMTIINYKKKKYSMNKIMCYTNNDRLLVSEEIATNMDDILPDGMLDKLCRIISIKHNIKR